MKRSYEKPLVVFESFTMSTNIANDCEKEVNNSTRGACGVKMSDGTTIFIVGETGCTIPPLSGSDDYNGFCYHAPTEENNLFNS